MMHWFCLSVEEVNAVIDSLNNSIYNRSWDSSTPSEMKKRDELMRLVEKLRFMLEHDR